MSKDVIAPEPISAGELRQLDEERQEQRTRDAQQRAAGRGEAVALLTGDACRFCHEGRPLVKRPIAGFTLVTHGELPCGAADLWRAIEKAGWV